MEKISCSIAKDLLPLYIEGILSEETTQVVEMHLQTCENCKKDFEIMRQEFVFPSAPKIQEENEKILKELMAETISAKRKEKNLSQSALAEITGINRSIIGRAENREFMPSVEQLQTLGEVYFIKTK